MTDKSVIKVKYSAIQILRFVAASFVIVDHGILAIIRNGTNIPYLDKYAYSFGDVGVFVFFGISGFIMVTTRYESFGSVRSSVDFILSRIIRLLPIYAIATTLKYINKCHAGDECNFIYYIKSLLFIPYIAEMETLYRPIIGQGWTLNYEMFFYLVFAISLSLPRVRGLVLSVSLFLALASLQSFNVWDNIIFKFYANHILLYFICGMLVAVTMKHLNLKVAKLFTPMLLVVILMLVSVLIPVYIAEEYQLFLNLIIVFVCVYACANCQPVHRGKLQFIWERLGDASYSTYIFHGFFLSATKFISKRIGDGQYEATLFFVVFCVIGANLTGLLSYTYLELPIGSFLNKYYRKFKAGH